MNYKKIIALLGVALCVSASWVNGSEMKCVEGGNQQQINFCASDAFIKADKEMNKLYKMQMAHLTEPYKTRLRESQRAWVIFRDKACLYEAGPQEESGSIWPLEQYTCLEKHTTKRIADLKSYVECRANGCPE
jgi:uncharacterized protein YecT (DUF1311 family)